MRYRYRAARRAAKKSRYNVVATVIIIAFLLYATITWILPNLIQGLGFIRGFLNTQTPKTVTTQSSTLAPPVLNIPYEATNTAQITIRGYATPKTKVSIYIDDQLQETTNILEDGTFEVKDIPLNLGTNNIYGKTSDANSESLPSKTIKVFYDSEKPALEIYEPEDGKEIQGERKINIRGKTEESAKVFVNGSRIIANSDGTFSTDYQLNDGENILTIKVVDEAFNFTEIERKVIFKP